MEKRLASPGSFVTGVGESEKDILDTSEIRIILRVTGERPDEIFHHTPCPGWLYGVTLFCLQSLVQVALCDHLVLAGFVLDCQAENHYSFA